MIIEIGGQQISNAASFYLSIAGVVATALSSVYGYSRRKARAKKEKEERADREIIKVLSKLVAQGGQVLEMSVVESLFNSTYKECEVDSLIDKKVPQIMDDLISEFTESAIIPDDTRQELILKVLSVKNTFQKGRKSNLEEVVADWRQLSILRSVFRVIYTSAVGFIAGFITIILLMIFAFDSIENIFTYLWVLITLTSFVAFTEYRKIKVKRDKSVRLLRNSLEENLIEVLHKIFPAINLERHARLSVGDQLALIDLVISSNDKKVPVEMKHGLVKQEDICRIAEVMRNLLASRGLIITSSKVKGKIKEFAGTKNIVLLEDITTREDLAKGLEYTKLFE